MNASVNVCCANITAMFLFRILFNQVDTVEVSNLFWKGDLAM